MNARLLSYDNKGWARRRLWFVAGLALLAASLIACSGSDDDAPSAVEPGMMTSSGSGNSSSGFAGAAQDGGAEESRGESASMGDDADSPGGAMAPAGTSGGVSPQPIADVLGRQVIRNGSVDLTVESVSEAFDQVRGIVDQAGGYLSNSTFSGQEESQRAHATVRVPAEQFDQVIADLRNLAVEVNSVSTSSQDVTEEFTDLEASLRNLTAVESQYLTLLGEAGDIGEILQVQDRLNGVRYELERVQGRLNLLENQTSLATLEIGLYPESSLMATAPGAGFGAEVREAWESSVDFITTAGTGIVVALVWSWWLIPFVVVGGLLARRYGGGVGRLGRTSRGAERVDTPEGAA